MGLAEDSSGNIYIADDHNPDASKKGIVVVPATTGTLFGQAVTAGTPPFAGRACGCLPGGVVDV